MDGTKENGGGKGKKPGTGKAKQPHPCASPSTSPRIRKAKYTLWAEWTMTPIQGLRKRQVGKA